MGHMAKFVLSSITMLVNRGRVKLQAIGLAQLVILGRLIYAMWTVFKLEYNQIYFTRRDFRQSRLNPITDGVISNSIVWSNMAVTLQVFISDLHFFCVFFLDIIVTKQCSYSLHTDITDTNQRLLGCCIHRSDISWTWRQHTGVDNRNVDCAQQVSIQRMCWWKMLRNSCLAWLCCHLFIQSSPVLFWKGINKKAALSTFLCDSLK